LKPTVIGISGGSGSGKTTVQERIIGSFGSEYVSLVQHDAYYRDLSHLRFEERVAFNFDHPNAFETELCVRQIDALLSGHTVESPIYDYERHVRSESTRTVGPRSVILVEGILVLAEAQLRERMDIKIYVDAPDDVRLIRRIQRDLLERGRTIESILDQYQRTVRPMHLEFVEPSKRFADIIIPGGGKNEVAMEMVLARVASIVLPQSD
jgi:uridine kinase